MEQTIDDLSKQLTSVLKKKNDEKIQMDSVYSNDIINSELVEYQDIDSLQRRNVELLALVRELAGDLENNEPHNFENVN